MTINPEENIKSEIKLPSKELFGEHPYFSVMEYLFRAYPNSVLSKDIENCARLPHSTVYRTLRRLRSIKIIQRISNPNDKRKPCYELTRLGREILYQMKSYTDKRKGSQTQSGKTISIAITQESEIFEFLDSDLLLRKKFENYINKNGLVIIKRLNDTPCKIESPSLEK
jgi:DNA-binding MarR family transcriptional regulator